MIHCNYKPFSNRIIYTTNKDLPEYPKEVFVIEMN